MTFRREYFLVFLSPLMLVCLGVGYIQASRRAGTRAAEDVPGGALYREVMEIVQTRYVNEPDEERLIYGAAKGIMDELDRHSVVYTPEQWADNELRARGHYVGIGILVDKLEEMVSVLEVLPNGPAERAGLRHGDRIVMIDGFTVDHRKPISEAMTHLRGKPRTTAILKVKALGGDTVRIVKVRRGIAPNRLVYGYFLDREAGIGFVHIEAFRATTVDLFDQEVRQLIQQGMTSLVLDLRGNPGGGLDSACRIADRFVSDGPIVTTVGRVPQRPRRATSEAPFAGLSVVVLTDPRCASASEVLAGALQDHSRGVLLGERTYGKGVVQEVAEFVRSGYPGGYKITTAHYFTPAGRCIEREVGLGESRRRRGGLRPDIPLQMTPQFTTKQEAANWYASRDRHRQRGRYDARVRKILERDEEPFSDTQVAAARDLLAEGWSTDRPLNDGR
ncbi:MAG: hypothetical protein CMJ83_04490 [Planctomycetes bacterium]|nr:hypothetical protein [Planctomycetota bacterium]